MATKKAQLVFENPPEKTSYNWSEIAANLRARPGEWAKVFDNDRTSLATAIRIGSIHALLPSDGFQVRTRNNTRDEPRMCTLYLRWVPQEKKGKKS